MRSFSLFRPFHPKGFALFLASISFSSIQAGEPVSSVPAPLTYEAVDWKMNTISPVANFIYFEDPIIRNEIRPVYAFHRIPGDFITGGGEAFAGGVQVRLAVTDRLGVFINQGGYLQVEPEFGPSFGGWADLGFGVKYALIDDKANQFILTPGLGFTVPSGDEDIFHGRGNGIWNFFVSAMKGFGDFHLTANVGYLQPNSTSIQSSTLRYSVQADYYCCRHFIPFVFFNGWTTTRSGNFLPLDAEGYDFFNFGAAGAEGVTQGTVGAGFRVRLTDALDFGIAYEKAVIEPLGLFDDRFTFDLSFRF